MNTISNQNTECQCNETAASPNAAQSVQRYVSPIVDISETAEAYLLKADLPGVSKEGVEITLENNTLTINGTRTLVETPGNRIYGESIVADYRRVFEVDPSIDSEHITAKIDQGVLTLTLPKAERLKARKVTVSG
jgi:HSP20 family protein